MFSYKACVVNTTKWSRRGGGSGERKLSVNLTWDGDGSHQGHCGNGLEGPTLPPLVLRSIACSVPAWQPSFRALVFSSAMYLKLLLLSRFSRVRFCVTHRWQPTRLPCPWDSPGKNTGVGCHFLLQCRKVKFKVKSLSRVRLLATPWTAAYQAPLHMGFSRQEYWTGVPLPSPMS